jgi:hypothetical protein
VIPWTEVEAIARAVPDGVRQQFVEFRARWRDHQVAYPRFVASADAIGCGPIVSGQPLTPRQEAYVCEHEDFEASGVLPAWEQRRAVLDAEWLGLHARALRVDADSEAGDLLELLDDQEVDGSAEKLRTAAASGPPSSTDRARRCNRPHPARPLRRWQRDRRAQLRQPREEWADDREQAVQLLSLAIVALVVLAGARSIVGGIGSSGDLFEGASTAPMAAGKRTPAVVAYVLDGDTVEVTTPKGRDVRVRLLGISAPEIPQPGKPGECYGSPSTSLLRQLPPAGTQVTLVSDSTQDDVDTYGR